MSKYLSIVPRFLCALALVVVSVSVDAQATGITSQPSPKCATPVFQVPAGSSITVTWLATTTGKDPNGNTVTLTTPVTYNLYNLNGANPVNIAPGLSTTRSTRTALNPGTVCYAVTAVAGGVESIALSNTASVLVLPPAPPTPDPPQGLTCTIVIPTGGTPVTGNCTAQ